MLENMKLENLSTPFVSFRVVTYNADETKALYKNRQMQLIASNFYRGETIKDEYNDYCDVYACYDGVAVGLWLGSFRTSYTIEEVMEVINRNGMDSLEKYMETVKTRLKKQDHFKLIEIEYIKHIAPELECQMRESRKVFSENLDRKRREQAAQQEAEEQEFVQKRNAESEQIVCDAIEILRNGGELKNQRVIFYENRYKYSSYSIFNYLMRKYGVKVPLRTQGWINEKLASVKIEQGNKLNVHYYKAKGARCSQKFFENLFELIEAVKAELV